MNRAQLQADLIRDEGMRLKAYQDTLGVWTIGCGHNLQDNEISNRAAIAILEDDISTVEHGLDRAMKWWRTLSEPRQRAIANLAFNVGITRLLGFRRALEAMQEGDFDLAADELLNSRWALQVGNRATRIAHIMRAG